MFPLRNIIHSQVLSSLNEGLLVDKDQQTMFRRMTANFFVYHQPVVIKIVVWNTHQMTRETNQIRLPWHSFKTKYWGPTASKSLDSNLEPSIAAISTRMIDRIFSGAVTRGPAQNEGKMSYTEFVWFLLAEEDKRGPTSIEYW